MDNPQQTFGFGRLRTIDEEFNSSMLALYDAYEAAGNLQVAGATGIDKGDLPKMFKPGSGRHLRYEAVFAIGQLASIELRRRALEPLARFWGFDVVERRPPLSDKERADRCEAALNALGPIGQEARRAALGF